MFSTSDNKFVLSVILAFFCYALTPQSTIVFAASLSGATVDNAAADNAAQEKTPEQIAAEKKAAEAEDERAVAQKLAVEKAEKKKRVQDEFEKTPLTVSGVVPLSTSTDDQGTIENGKPLKLGKAGMGDRISIVIKRLSEAIANEAIDPAKLVLFIDGRVFKDVYPDSVGYDSLTYKLERTKEALDAWNGLLGSPRLDSLKPVLVSVGYANQKPLTAEEGPLKSNLNLIVYRRKWALASLIGLVLMVLLFMKYGTKDLLRDSRPPNPPQGKQKPYSLAKVQVAWWFFLVIGCFLLIYLITGEYTMTEQALILIGIGTGTALGSAMIDSGKRDSSDAELDSLLPELAKLNKNIELLKPEVNSLEASIGVKRTALAANAAATATEQAALKTDEEAFRAKAIELAEKQEKRGILQAKISDAKAGLEQPVSGGFWDDLVTDANGVSFHRFQMIVWTVILGILFLAAVYRDLAMPQFSGTMLALMGISAGTYLGFKIPEKQNTAEPDTVDGDNDGAAGAAGSPDVAPTRQADTDSDERAKADAEAQAKADAEAQAEADAEAQAHGGKPGETGPDE